MLTNLPFHEDSFMINCLTPPLNRPCLIPNIHSLLWIKRKNEFSEAAAERAESVERVKLPPEIKEKRKTFKQIKQVARGKSVDKEVGTIWLLIKEWEHVFFDVHALDEKVLKACEEYSVRKLNMKIRDIKAES